MSAGDLTTLANVKAYIPSLGTVTTFDALLGRLITAASAWIKSYLNRDILATTYVETLDGTGTTALMVGQYPITALTSLVVDGRDVTADAVFSRRMIRLKAGKFYAGVGNVVVNYTAGYAAPPYDLEQACIELVAWRFRERERLGLASKSLQTGGEVESYQTADVPASVKTILNNWRKVVA